MHPLHLCATGTTILDRVHMVTQRLGYLSVQEAPWQEEPFGR